MYLLWLTLPTEGGAETVELTPAMVLLMLSGFGAIGLMEIVIRIISCCKQ